MTEVVNLGQQWECSASITKTESTQSSTYFSELAKSNSVKTSQAALEISKKTPKIPQHPHLSLAENRPVWKEQVNSVFLERSQQSLDDADLSVQELCWFLCLVTRGHIPELWGSAGASFPIMEVAKVVAIKISCYPDATWVLMAEKMGTETTERAFWHWLRKYQFLRSEQHPLKIWIRVVSFMLQFDKGGQNISRLFWWRSGWLWNTYIY